MKKIIYGFIALAVLMAFQSCQKDDDEIFEKSAAQRIQEAVDADKALLESASNGWEMRYYTGEDYNRGGYTMFMKFVNGKAYVSSDIAPSSMVTESSYDVLRGEGPVLTFNTHNTIMHFLAQPYQDDVTGEQGDYEFVIMRTTQDSIFVKGRKWGNKMVLTRVDAGKEWKSSIDKMQNVFHSMEYFYMENSENPEGVYFDPASRRAYIGVLGNSSISTAYTTTEDGVEFKDSVEIAGKKVKMLSWNAQNQTLCLKDGSVLCSSYELPGYKRIDTYYGNWEVSYITKKATNEGEADEMGTFPISFSANTKKISPFPLRRIFLPVRSNRGYPNSFSRCCMVWLKEDWEINKSCADCEMFCFCVTKTFFQKPYWTFCGGILQSGIFRDFVSRENEGNKKGGGK